MPRFALKKRLTAMNQWARRHPRLSGGIIAGLAVPLAVFCLWKGGCSYKNRMPICEGPRRYVVRIKGEKTRVDKGQELDSGKTHYRVVGLAENSNLLVLAKDGKLYTIGRGWEHDGIELRGWECKKKQHK